MLYTSRLHAYTVHNHFFHVYKVTHYMNHSIFILAFFALCTFVLLLQFTETVGLVYMHCILLFTLAFYIDLYTDLFFTYL